MGTKIHVSVRTNTLIIGGGIIGVSIASSLTDRDVMIIDSGEPRFGTSIGNAGHVVVSHAQPFAAPGMIAMGAKSLLHADGAFAFSAHLPLQAASWIASFMRNCTKGNVEKFTPGILSLLRTSAELIHSSGVTTTSLPTWEVFTSHKAIEQSRVESEHFSHLGIRALLINRSEALEQEPSLTPKVKAVVELGEDFGLDPRELWQRLRATNPDLIFHSHELATAIAPFKGQYLVTTTSGMQIRAKNIVIAAGSWSGEVGALLGIKVPIIAAKGYSVTVPMRKGTNSLHPMIFADEKTATDPLGDHLRMSARFELTHANDRSIKEKRIRQLYKRAATVLNLPLVPTDLAELCPWTGLRPASADGAPYIGLVPDLPGVYLATGHGLIGTALSLGTADLISRYIRRQAVTPAELTLSPHRSRH